MREDASASMQGTGILNPRLRTMSSSDKPFADPTDPVPIDVWEVEPATEIVGASREWWRLTRNGKDVKYSTDRSVLVEMASNLIDDSNAKNET
jgi:hypothetical protein